MRSAKFYSQVMALFDRFSVLPVAAVTQETESLAQKLSLTHPVASSSSLHSSSQLTREGATRGEDSRMTNEDSSLMWGEVAKLLTRCGSWRTTLAMLDGLPPSSRAVVVGRAVREKWPMPPEALLTLRMTTPGAETSAMRSGGTSNAAAPDAKQTNGADSAVIDAKREHNPSPFSAESAAALAWAASSSSPVPLMSKTIDEILALAFSCRRPNTKAAALTLQGQQKAIIAELYRRNMTKELLQCIVNWRHRGLVADPFYASTTTTAEPAAAAASGKKGGKGLEDVPLYDGIAAVRVLLFPPPPPSLSSSAPPSPSASPAVAWRVALDAFPLLFARCVRDGAACTNFLRNGTATTGDVCDAALALLKHVGEVAAQSPFSPPKGPHRHAGGGGRSATSAAEDVEVLWRAVNCLLKGVQGWLRLEPKTTKETLLQTVGAALAATVQVQRWLTAPAPAEAGVHVKPDGGAVAGRCVSGKTVAAVRGAVETVCSILPQHEAQVRFMRLSLFAQIALSLEDLAAFSQTEVGLTNGLIQCLFLCLGDVGGSRDHPAVQSGLDQPLKDTTLACFLDAPPMERWEPALQLTKTAQAKRWFRVSSTHLHSLLSGLQSISIVNTWQEALRCVEFFDKQLHVRPDDSTMPIVLLNLSQDSWSRAFDVLAYYKESRRPPPAAVMRDLHLTSVKHGAWEATLRLMRQLVDLNRTAEESNGYSRRQTLSPSSSTYVGVMNYLYSLYAAGIGGKVGTSLSLLAALAQIPGKRLDTSPFSEVTVAVAGVALLDNAHYTEAVAFANRILNCGNGSAPAHAQERDGVRQELDSTQNTAFTLTPAGREMTAALKLLGMLHLWRGEGTTTAARWNAADVVTLVNSLCTASTTAARARDKATAGEEVALRRVLRYAITLSALCGMRQLNSPIRLVFDTVAGPGVYETCARGGERTFETRQVNLRMQTALAAGRHSRRALYIPHAHRQSRAAWLARSLGAVVKHSEDIDDRGAETDAAPQLSPEATRAVAEEMANAGVGPEFLEASLL